MKSSSSGKGDLGTQPSPWQGALEAEEAAVLHNSDLGMLKNNMLLSRAKKESNLSPSMTT